MSDSAPLYALILLVLVVGIVASALALLAYFIIF